MKDLEVVTKAKPTSQEEKDYLSKRFSDLSKTNKEVVGYIYAPGTDLDEPVVQTNDNETYLNKTFEGGNVPFLGTVLGYG